MTQTNQNPISEEHEVKLTKKHLIIGLVILIAIAFISTFGWWRGNPTTWFKGSDKTKPTYQLNNDDDKKWYESLQQNLTELEDYPNSFGALVGIARARAYFKDYEEAIKMYQEANKISPKNNLAWANLGYLYIDLGKYEEAEKCLLQAIKNKPTEVGYYVDLSLMYYEKMGKKDKAEQILLQGLSNDLNKNSGTLMSALASYYEKEGNNAEALKWYGKMLEINPDNQAVKEKIEELKGK